MNLDTERNPCRETTDYNYATCINTRVAKSVGCQSFWSNLTGFPVCSDYAQYHGYALEYERFISLEKNQLLAETGCVRPCNYMEYAVGNIIREFISINVSILTASGHPNLRPASVQHDGDLHHVVEQHRHLREGGEGFLLSVPGGRRRWSAGTFYRI